MSCGLQVAHTSYDNDNDDDDDNDDDNDKRNSQPATAVTFRYDKLGILFA